MKIIPVRLSNNRAYNIYIGYGLTSRVSHYIRKYRLGNFAIVLVPRRVYARYRQVITKAFRGISTKIIKIADGEGLKSKEWLFKIVDEIIKVDTWDKNLYLVCLGGGTVGDIGGFVASIYKRGIPYIQIPTTLLAQIDAAIGGKTSIDLKEAKNILGTFYQPRAVFIDPSFLSTLTAKEIKDGIAEAIKYGIIKDRDFLSFLSRHCEDIKALKPSCILRLISTCVSIKASIIREDEDEKKGLRTILNFGHTLAHALEAAFRYARLSHGEAVSVGMVYAAWFSYFLGMCNRRDFEAVIEIIRKFSLPINVPFNYQALYRSLLYDKKFMKGTIRMVLLRSLGKVEVIDGISLQRLKQSLKLFCRPH